MAAGQGQHYYAKVKGLDVVGKDGKVKWNSAERAQEVSEEYMEEIRYVSN